MNIHLEKENKMLRDQIKTELVEAMKSQNTAKVNTLCLVQAAIKQKDIDARVKGVVDGIDDAAVLSLLQGMIKKVSKCINKEDVMTWFLMNRQKLISYKHFYPNRWMKLR